MTGLVAEWSPSDEFDEVGAASSMPDHPNVWTDGSLVLDRVTGVSSSAAGFLLTYLNAAGVLVSGVRLMIFVQMMVFRFVGVFFSVPGPLQSVQRAERWGVILALQSSGAVHLGVDNLGVVRHVGRLLDGCHGSPPFELVKDGDLLLLIEKMLSS